MFNICNNSIFRKKTHNIALLCDDFDSYKNIEVQEAQQQIQLLTKYICTNSLIQKHLIFRKFNNIVQYALSNKIIEPDTLIKQIKTAINKDKYRPRNLPICMLALYTQDLENIHGDFNTFDNRFVKMQKDHTSKNKIRQSFNSAILNRNILSKQFAYDWIRYITQHEQLAKTTKKANNSLSILFYNKLLKKLADDFCAEHNIPTNNIDIQIVQNWYYSALRHHGTELEKKNVQGITLFKNKSDITNKYATIQVIISFNEIQKTSRKKKINLFDYMLAAFAHEMNHILDELQPRHGCVGPQVMTLDNKTYTDAYINKQAYFQSATEISSFAIQDAIIRQLKQYCR